MSAHLAMMRGQAAAERLMVDACTITRTTTLTTDDLTGAATPMVSTIYTGKCRIQDASGRSVGRRVDVGEVSDVLVRLQVQLPVGGSEGVARNDIVTVTASVDADLVGRTFKVHDLAHKTHMTARRIGIEEVT